MMPPTAPHVLAEVGGVAVAEQGPLVIVIDRGTGPWATTSFVLGVIALVVGGFGAVTLALSATDGAAVPWWISAIFLAVGVAVACGAFAAVHRIRKARLRPVSDYRPVAIFDRARRVLLDAGGTVVAPLHEIRFDTRMQLTSSSPVLVVVTLGGTREIKRGNPFTGGIGNLEAVLTAAVFGQQR